MSGEGPWGAAGAPVCGPGVAGFAGDASSVSGTGRFPQQHRPLEEGGSWGKHGFPHGREPKANDGHSLSEEPKPPDPRSLSGSSATSVSSGPGTATTTSCAIRIPGSTTN